MKNFDKFIIFILFAISFFPHQMIAYTVPFLLFPLLLIRSNFRFFSSDKYTLENYIFYFFIFILIAFASSLINQSNYINFLLATLTFFAPVISFINIFLFPYDKKHLTWAISLIIFFSVIQIPIGIYQIYRGIGWDVINPFKITKAAGDFFVGTLGSNSTLVAVKMVFVASITTALFINTKKRKYLVLALILALGWILPSAMHTIILAVAILILYIVTAFIKKFFRMLLSKKLSQSRIILALVAITVLSVFSVMTQKNNINYAINRISIFLGKEGQESNRKWIGLKNTIFKLPHEKYYAPLIGVGIGSYSSRAALILSGEYLRQQPDFIPISLSKETKKFIVPLWNRELLEDPTKHGVANQPFSTWQSMYGELGLAGIFMLCLVFFQNLKAFSLSNHSSNMYQKSISNSMKFFTFYLFFLFFFDNWFEYPRFMIPYWIFLGLLIKELRSAKSNQKEKEVHEE